MRRVLLISNKVLPYRVRVYNEFTALFKADGYEFHVASNEYQAFPGDTFLFGKHEAPFKAHLYKRLIDELRPDAVILFLHLKDRIYYPVLHYCNRHRIPVIFWNKPLSSTGANPAKINPLWKRLLYYHVHDRCDALITYSERLRQGFKDKNQAKLFVAPNTVSFAGIDKAALPHRAEIKGRYGIDERHVVLYVGRMDPVKRPELLLDAFGYMSDPAVVYVGKCSDEALLQRISQTPNAYYLGSLSGKDSDEIWSIADVFSTPGNIGLAMNEALFWGVPVVIMKGFHPPEKDYMVEGETGFVASGEDEFKHYVLTILENDSLRDKMKKASLEECEKKISLEAMYGGFKAAIEYALSRKACQR